MRLVPVGAALLVLVRGLWTSEPAYTRDWLLIIATAWLCYCVGKTGHKNFALTLKLSLQAYAVLLAGSTVFAGIAWKPDFHLNYRPIVWFFDNPNLLAAALTISAIIGLGLTRHPFHRMLLQLLFVSAILLTGSRTGILAYVVANAVEMTTSIISHKRLTGRTLRWKLLEHAPIIGVVILVVWALNATPSNLLYAPTDFADTRWIRPEPDKVLISVSNEEPPYPSDSAVFRVTADALATEDSSSLLVYQNLGPGIPSTEYVVSIYMKSPEPQEVILSSNYTRTSCSIDSVWSNCIAPVAVGDGHTRIMLQLRTQNQSGQFYIWGPRIEEGSQLSGGSPMTQSLADVLHQWGVLDQLSLGDSESGRGASRIQSFRAALAAFQRYPWTGAGYSQLPAWVATHHAEVAGRFAHAHNFALQLLGEIGIIGLLAYAMLIAAAILTARRGSFIWPVCVAAIILNCIDYTHFHAGGYYVFWIALGWASAESPGMRVGDKVR